MPERRPRVSAELAERIDRARGDVPFERWVRRALEEAVGSTVLDFEAVEVAPGVLRGRPVPARPEGSPRSEPFVCPVASCQWAGAKKESDGPCPTHRRNLIARRS